MATLCPVDLNPQNSWASIRFWKLKSRGCKVVKVAHPWFKASQFLNYKILKIVISLNGYVPLAFPQATGEWDWFD